MTTFVVDQESMHTTGLDTMDPVTEACYLPTLGPTATVLMRRIAGVLVSQMQIDPDPHYHLDFLDSMQFGVRPTQLERSITRLVRFGVLTPVDSQPDTLQVRLVLPYLRGRSLDHVPAPLQAIARGGTP